MQEKSFKTKDMIIAIFCTLLAILCIVFYFLPAFNIKHSTSPMQDFEVIDYSAWEITRAALSGSKVIGYNWDGLMYIKEVYGFAIILAGILTPLALVCSVVTAVFAYLSWFKGETFKKFCFMFSLIGMVFQTISLILVWFIAIMSKDGNNYSYYNNNIKGGMSYGAFVSLILVFVIAIVACAYNYFLEDYDDEDEEEDDEDDEDEDDVPRSSKKKRVIEYDDDEEVIIVKKKKTVTEDGAEQK